MYKSFQVFSDLRTLSVFPTKLLPKENPKFRKGKQLLIIELHTLLQHAPNVYFGGVGPINASYPKIYKNKTWNSFGNTFECWSLQLLILSKMLKP